jgi:hypothetical protein
LGQPQRYRAFSAKLRAQYWTESGREAARSRTFHRRADGSYVFESEVDDPSDPNHGKLRRFRNVLNVSGRTFTITEPFVEAAVTRPLVDDGELNTLAAAYGECASLTNGTWKEINRSSLLGLEVIEVEVERTERTVVTHWVAPDLDCFSLKHTTVIDGRLRTLEKAVSIDPGEPDTTVLNLPKGYALVSPLELEARYQARFPGMELFGDQALRMEETYQRSIEKARVRK